MGKGNHFFVWSGGWKGCFAGSPPLNQGDGINYFGLSNLTGVLASNGQPYDTTSITPLEASAIDKKMDDGYPQSGRVLALYPSDIPGNNCWAAGNSTAGAYNAVNAGPTTASTAPASTNCYDNGGSAGTQTYSVSGSAAGNGNCALSFMFQ